MTTRILLITIAVSLTALLYGQCTDDCVYPGDLNANGIANHMDILALGIAFGETGPARINPNTNWDPQDADDWAGSLPVLGTNFKHCDADGFGIVDENDQFPIGNNYNETNDKFMGLLGNNIPGNDLFLVPIQTATAPGDTMRFEIHLGSAGNTINNIYGLGFMIEIDSQYIQTATVDFNDSWLGMPDELISINKYDFSTMDHIGVGVTRTDGVPVSGSGQIGSLRIVVTEVVIPLEIDSTECIPTYVGFKNVLGLDPNEQDLQITSTGVDQQIKHASQIPNPVKEIYYSMGYDVFPNPVIDFFNIQFDQMESGTVSLHSPTGKIIYQESLINEQNIPVSVPDVPPGVYLLHIETPNGIIMEKIIKI